MSIVSVLRLTASDPITVQTEMYINGGVKMVAASMEAVNKKCRGLLGVSIFDLTFKKT